MIQEINQQYDIDNNEFEALFYQEEQGFCLKNFFEQLELLKSPKIHTYHTENVIDRNEVSDLSSGHSDFTDKSPDIQNKQLSNSIECSLATLFELRKSKKGRQKEFKNIYQIFKRETMSFLSIQSKIGILSEQDQCHVEKFQQETSTLKSFNQLLKTQKVKQKLTEFYYTPDFVQGIMKNRRLSLERKIQVVKHLKGLTKILNSEAR